MGVCVCGKGRQATVGILQDLEATINVLSKTSWDGEELERVEALIFVVGRILLPGAGLRGPLLFARTRDDLVPLVSHGPPSDSPLRGVLIACIELLRLLLPSPMSILH